MIFLKKTVLMLLLLLLPLMVVAAPYEATMMTLDTVMTIIFSLCHAVGIVFIFLSFIYFRRFRQNSIETPLSRVLWTLGLGLAIFFLPLLAQYNKAYRLLEQSADIAETQGVDQGTVQESAM